ncbi:MAG: hypothetical protein GVY22_01435, partial [Gammaproteobacteria bacterium]|nr:hypothetical protein [Gammaproteobacteria bacterium]
MATSASIAAVQQMYVAYYGRPADPLGLQYWAEVLDDNGGNVGVIADSFGALPEYTDNFAPFIDDQGVLTDPEGAITLLFQQMFNRDPDAAGLAFYVDLLNGTNNSGFNPDLRQSSLADLAMDIAFGATGSDETVLANKAEVATFFTGEVEALRRDFSAEDIDGAQAIISEVGESQESVDAGLQASASFVQALPAGPEPEPGLFTLQPVETEIPDDIEPELMWGYTPGDEYSPGLGYNGITAEDMLGFLREIAGVDFVQLGLIDSDGSSPEQIMSEIGNITIGDISLAELSDETLDQYPDIAQGQAVDVTIEMLDGTTYSAEASLGGAYLNFLSDLLFDADGNSRLFYGFPPDSEYYDLYDDSDDDIVLTPIENNGGTFENGFTSDGDDLIVAGRLELLHGAYLNAGGGYDILEVDAKGTYAQPLQLLNIEEISVQNLANVYDNNPDVPSSYPDLADETYGEDLPQNSVFDISRASSLESLIVTEGWDNSSYADVGPGDLSIVGIRNGVTTRLEGGFTQDIYLHYGRDLGDSVSLELSLGDTEDFNLYVAQNTNTLNLDSQGNENWLESAWFGGMLRTLNVTGEAALYIEGDLTESFHTGRPATIDASANTGGVDLTLNEHGENASDVLTFLGTEADDSFTSEDSVAVDVQAGEGNNFVDVDGSLYINVTAGAGDDVVSAFGHYGEMPEDDNGEDYAVETSESIVIDAGDGANEVVAGGSYVDITTGAGADSIAALGYEVNVSTGDGDDLLVLAGAPHSGEAMVTIDLGAGDDTLVLGEGETPHFGTGLTALDDSSITGESIHIDVDYDSDISRATLDGVSSVTLAGEMAGSEDDGDLTISAEQFAAIGAAAFTVDRASFGEVQDLHIVVTEDVTLSELVELADLSANVRLHFDIRNGATLTLSAEELHTYVAEDGIISDDGLNGKVVITDAGLDFDAFNDQGSAVVIPGGPAVIGGSLSGDFAGSDDITIIRTFDGFVRPEPDPSTDTLTVDSTGLPEPLVIDAEIETDATKLEIIGDQSVVFENPVDLGDDFVVDFSGLVAGEVPEPGEGEEPVEPVMPTLDLTLANFQDITASDDSEDWGEIIGNGAEGGRLDVIMGDDGEDGSPSTVELLKTSGVAQYVVTGIADEDQAVIRLCDETKDVQVIGLQGNAGRAIAFTDIPWGSVRPSFLLEGDGYADYDQTVKVDGDPDLSNIGTLIGSFFHPGAPAVINIDNQGVALGETSTGGPRPLAVDGILLENAGSAEINVTDGNAIIGNLSAADASDIVLNSDFGVAVWLDENSGVSDWSSIDASGVADDAIIGVGAFDGGFDPMDFDGSGIALDFSEIEMSGVAAVAIADGAELTLSLDQFEAVALVPAFDPADGGSATLNLTGLADQEFSLDELPEGVELGSLTLADDPEVTLNPLTDLTGINTLVVPEGTTLNLTAEQYNQLSGNADGDKIIVMGDEDTAGQVNITDMRQEDAVFENEDGETVAIDLSGVVADDDIVDDAMVQGTITLAEAVVTMGELIAGEPNLNAVLGGFGVELAADQEVIFTNATQAHERAVAGDAATSMVGLAFAYDEVDTEVDFDEDDVADETGLDLSGYTGIVELNVWNTLVQGQNVEQILAFLSSDTVVDVNDPPEGFEGTTNRVVTVQPGVSIGTNADDESLLFQDLRDDWEVESLDISLLGGSEVSGTLDISLPLVTDYEGNGFQLLTINSSAADGELEPNVMGDVLATNNNLLNVVINADHPLEMGTITFSALEDASTASLTIDGDAPVTIDGLVPGDNIVGIDVATDDEPATLVELIQTGAGGLVIAETMDLSNLELEISADQPIILKQDVTLTLNAATANGLTIIPDPELDMEALPDSQKPVVNVVDLNDGEVDLSGIDEGIAGTVSLQEADPALGLPAQFADVTLNEDTDLGAFTLNLLGLGDDINDGQTVRFQSAEQASVAIDVIEVPDPADSPLTLGTAGTNVVWLFNDPAAADLPVETNDYDAAIGRVWMNDQLVDGQNVEDLFTFLPDSILRVEFTGDIPEALTGANPIDRIVEVVAFTELENGLSFSDEEPAPFVENLTIYMGGNVSLGDLLVDNVVGPDVQGNTDFETLTLNSELADPYDDADPLVPEDWEEGDAVPSEANTFGDVSSGTVHVLENVVLNANEVGLVGGTITFDADETSTAVLTVGGDFDVTLKSVNTDDAEIETLKIKDTGAGTFAVTGGSPAADLGNTEALILDVTDALDGDGNDVDDDVYFGYTLNEDDEWVLSTDDSDNPYAGVAGEQLSTVNVNGGGTVALGVLAQFDGSVDDDATPPVPGFVLTSTAANGSATLGEADVDGTLVAPTLADEQVWTFTNGGMGTEFDLTITEDVTFEAGGTLNLNSVDVVIDGAVDLTTLADGLSVAGGSFDVTEDSTLTLTAAQADGLTITGEGAVAILALEETPAADLSGITAETVTAALDSTGDVDITGDLGSAAVTISGDGMVSVSGTIGEASFTVGADATLALTATQADEREADGDGTVTVADLGAVDAPDDVDLSGLTATTVNAAVDTSTTLTDEADLGTATVTIATGVTLTVPASVADGKTIAGDGTVTITGDATGIDLSNVTASIAFDAAATVDGVTFPTLAAGQSVTMTAAQADGETINGANSNADGEVAVTNLGGDPVDLSGIAVQTTTATVPADATLDAATNLGTASVDVEAGAELTLTGAQASGRAITGAGDVVITGVAAGDDLSGLAVTGNVTIQAAEGETTLTLTAAQADGATVEGVDGDGNPVTLDTVTVTDFEDASGADLTGVDATTLNVELDSTGDVEIGADANLAAAAVSITGTGTVTVDPAATLGTATFDIGQDATLVTDADETLVPFASVAGGNGMLEVAEIVGQSLDVRAGAPDFDGDITYTFEESASTSEVIGFAVSAGGLADVLDLNAVFAATTTGFDQGAYSDADQSGAPDLIAYNVAIAGLTTAD